MRLKYAGRCGCASGTPTASPGPPCERGPRIAGPVIEADLGRALDRALAVVPPGETLYCVLTYTAMLDLRRVLTERGHLAPYWQVES